MSKDPKRSRQRLLVAHIRSESATQLPARDPEESGMSPLFKMERLAADRAALKEELKRLKASSARPLDALEQIVTNWYDESTVDEPKRAYRQVLEARRRSAYKNGVR